MIERAIPIRLVLGQNFTFFSFSTLFFTKTRMRKDVVRTYDQLGGQTQSVERKRESESGGRRWRRRRKREREGRGGESAAPKREGGVRGKWVTRLGAFYGRRRRV